MRGEDKIWRGSLFVAESPLEKEIENKKKGEEEKERKMKFDPLLPKEINLKKRGGYFDATSEDEPMKKRNKSLTGIHLLHQRGRRGWNPRKRLTKGTKRDSLRVLPPKDFLKRGGVRYGRHRTGRGVGGPVTYEGKVGYKWGRCRKPT